MRATEGPQIVDLATRARRPSTGCRPLALWRSERLRYIEGPAISEVRRDLAGRVSLFHRSWPAARRGDPAAAIAVALDLTRVTVPEPAVLDLAVSAVLVAAWMGDAAAETVLAHVLRAKARPGRVGGPRGAGNPRPERPKAR